VLILSGLQGDADGALDRLWQQKRAEIKQYLSFAWKILLE
jgi:hypothetical protein